MQVPNTQLNITLKQSLVLGVLIAICMWRLDLPLSALIAEYLGTYAPSIKNSNIPDTLLFFVLGLTAISWSVYFYMDYKRMCDQRMLMSLISGIVLPLSYVLKVFLKWLIGRTETRIWLFDPSLYGFHWLHGAAGFRGFPSGHMLVFTPLFLLLWQFYPRYQRYYLLTWIILGMALIITEYHFLSDVLAGGLVGGWLYLLVRNRLMPKPV